MSFLYKCKKKDMKNHIFKMASSKVLVFFNYKILHEFGCIISRDIVWIFH